MELSLVFLQGMVAPFDHIVHSLAADAKLLCHFTQGIILQHHTFIYLLLALCQKLPVKIIQQCLFYKLLHLLTTLGIIPYNRKDVKYFFLTSFSS